MRQRGRRIEAIQQINALHESTYLGTPAVSIGTRQRDRESDPNVVFTSHDTVEIADVVRALIAHRRYERNACSVPAPSGTTIADAQTTVTPPVQKRLQYEATAPLGDPAQV